jgi:O-antigen ligase
MATSDAAPWSSVTAINVRRLRRAAPGLTGGVFAVALGVAVGVGLAVDIRIGMALALAVLVVPIALVDPPLIVALWAALAVFSRYPGFGLALTATGFTALGAWLARARADRGALRRALRPHGRLLAVAALLLAWLTLSQAWAADSARAGTGVIAWYVNALAGLAMLTLLRTPRDVEVVIAALIGAVAASALLGLGGLDLGAPTTAEGRLVGASGDPNFMAAFIVAALALAATLLGASRSAWRVALPAVIAVLVVGLAATESRGGLLAAFAGLLAALLVMRGRRVAVVAVASLVLLAGGVWVSANPGVIERVQSAESDRGNGREDLWIAARRMGAEHPLTGVGLDNFTLRSPEYVREPGALSYVELVVERPHETHNTYLQLFAETGLIGLGLFTALVFTALASAARAARAFERAGRRDLALLARGVLVANLALLAAATFISAQSTAVVWVVLALGPVLLGVACADATRREG